MPGAQNIIVYVDHEKSGIQLDLKYCPRCGKELPADANFCLNCGAPVAMPFMQVRSGLVTAAGVLMIIAASISGIDGLISLAASISSLSSPYYYPYDGMSSFYATLLVVGSFALIGFAVGLAAGIQSLRRKQFTLVIVGSTLLMLSGIWNFSVVFAPYGVGITWAIMFGIPIIILDLLGLVFVATKKQEFTKTQAPTKSVVIP